MAPLLAAAPAQLFMRGAGGVLPTHCAAAAANEAGLRALLAAGGDADAFDEAGLSALHLACAGGHGGCVRELVAACADINGSSVAFPWTPLHCATAFAGGEGGLDCIRALLSAGADRALAPTAGGRTPRELAQACRACMGEGARGKGGGVGRWRGGPSLASAACYRGRCRCRCMHVEGEPS